MLAPWVAVRHNEAAVLLTQSHDLDCHDGKEVRREGSFLDFFRFLWISLDFCGFLRISVEFYEFLRASLNFCGFLLISVDFYEFLWISMNFCGHL